MSDSEHYEIGAVPAAIFTGGLDFEQEVTLQTISECLTRGEGYLRELVNGNEKLRHEFEPLHRILSGISMGAVIPIIELITKGNSPPDAIRSVISGIGGLMFFGGIEYAKAMGLNGVGVPLPTKTYAADEYPEEKPVGNDVDLEKLLSASFGDNEEDD